MQEALRLIQEEGFCMEAAGNEINEVKKNRVPRNTIRNTLDRQKILGEKGVMPPLGRRQVRYFSC